MCIQCVLRPLQLIHLSETKDYNNGGARSAKHMILISIQCVLNVYSMGFQAFAADIYHFSKTNDYNNGVVPDQFRVKK